jgi:hypothetical protein
MTERTAPWRLPDCPGRLSRHDLWCTDGKDGCDYGPLQLKVKRLMEDRQQL